MNGATYSKTPLGRPFRLSTFLPISEWLHGEIHNSHYNGGSVNTLDVTNIQGRDCSISFSDPEITRLRVIINDMGAEPDGSNTFHKWLDPSDPNDQAFYEKLFYVVNEGCVYHTMFSYSEDVYVPTHLEVGLGNGFIMLSNPAIGGTTAFPNYGYTLRSTKVAQSQAINLPDEALKAMPIDDSDGYPQASDYPHLSGDTQQYPNDGTEKGVLLHITEDEYGCIGLIKSQQIYASKACDVNISKYHTSFTGAEFIDEYNDYVMIHTPLNLNVYLQNLGPDMTFKANVKRSHSNDAGVYVTTPFCSLLGVHANGGSTTELSVQDITVSGHKLGWTNVAYSPGGEGADNTDIGGHAIRLNDDIMTHAKIGQASAAGAVDKDLAIGVLPTLPLGWVKSKVKRFSSGETDVVMQEYNNFVPFRFRAELSSSIDRYTAESGGNSDEGLVVSQADVHGVLDSGYIALAGSVNHFGECRWTIE